MSYTDKKIKRIFNLSSDLTLEITKWETTGDMTGHLISKEGGTLTLLDHELSALRGALIISVVFEKVLEGKKKINLELNIGDLGITEISHFGLDPGEDKR